MDEYEATKIVLSRIQSLDPENASKIMGLLLLQDHGEKEMIRLAFGPESLLHSVIVKAKKKLGLISSLWSQDELISPKNKIGSSLNPNSLPFYSNGGRSCGHLANDFELMDDLKNQRSDFLSSVHARSGSCGLDGVNCSQFASGCRFIHGDGVGVGGAELISSQRRIELLRSNSVPPRLAHHFLTRSSLTHQNDSQRVAALMMGDELQKLGRWRPERIDLSGIACPASRQIYLTFPADSKFSEEDVSNYFSTFGPVQDVRIPYQQKRMFGFVTFLYPETVKSILAKGNPHFVCDSRVLVKPYKEKGKVPDKFRTNQTTEIELSPTGLDSIPRDAIGGRGFYSNTQDGLWRSKFEEEILELQNRRLMNLQLLDVKKQFQLNSPTHIPNPFSQTFVSPRPLSMKAGEYVGREIAKSSYKEVSDDDTMKLPERLEDSLPDSPFGSSTDHLLMFTESEDNNNISDSWSPTSDNDTLSDSFTPFNCEMPRLLPIGMLPGRDGPTCRVAI